MADPGTLPSLKSLVLEIGQERTVASLFERIVEGLRAEPSVALARLWLLRPGDICATCPLQAECEDRARCLHLVASAGSPVDRSVDWDGLDGSFRRFPLGVRKVGHIAAAGETVEVNEIDQGSRWIADAAWATRESIRGFVGHPVSFRGEVLGVLGVFLRTVVSDETVLLLRMLADHAAAAIINARAFTEIERLRGQLELENTYLRDEVKAAHQFGEIVGGSPVLAKILEQVQLVAPTDTSVLILGESGVGKELFARAIHEHGERGGRPLIKVNCASIPRELFESEFFGHTQGAFTGAVRDRLGRFELADGGTLFLDEVGEIPLELQGKLLRVLQEGTFERVGEASTRTVDVRVVAATNRDLAAEVKAGRFREDLYYRLSVFPIEVPSLRERTEDIPLLATHFLERHSRRLGLPLPRFTRRHARELEQYDWPGNVRELQNVMERAVIRSRLGPLAFDLPTGRRRSEGRRAQPEPASEAPLTDAEMKERERRNIVRVLERSGWKVSGAGGAAEYLGIHPATLSSRMRAWGIERPR